MTAAFACATLGAIRAVRSTRRGIDPMSSAIQGRPAAPVDRRWLVLVVVAIAQLMVVLDSTVVNIALPSAQRSLGFSNNDRQWVVTAYALAFGSLLLVGGRLGDMFSRKRVFITGLAGFAVSSAIGGAAVSFEMLVAARTLQGAFGAILAPSALGTLVSTFRDPRERGRAFGVFGSVAAGGGGVGLILGGLLTQYLSWRWTLYINLVFAAIAIAGALAFMRSSRPAIRPRMDYPGAILACAGLFLIVFGFSHAETAGLQERAGIPDGFMRADLPGATGSPRRCRFLSHGWPAESARLRPRLVDLVCGPVLPAGPPVIPRGVFAAPASPCIRRGCLDHAAGTT
jgi:MFS family permease